MHDRTRLALALSLSLSTPVLAADGVISSHETRVAEPHDTYGTIATTAEVVGAYECDPFDPAQVINPQVGTPNRFTTGYMICPFTVPAGASLVSMELEACDTTATAEATMDLLNTTTPAGSGSGIATVGTGIAATPGCSRTSLNIPGTPQVNNGTQKWALQVRTSGSTTFAAGRVLYRLNVSPAPATATFTDVPVGSPQHRFVEALVAIGVTGGCGGGLFCPDAPVTRGQMAVFIASTLGLHFAP